MKIRQAVIIWMFIFVLSVLAVGCGGSDNGGVNVIDATSTPDFTATPGPTPTPTPVPVSLVVCLGDTPNTLYPYGNPNAAARLVLQALYDGPVDQLGYRYQPVLMESLPDIAAGTAELQAVEVGEGDTVLDNQGNVITLDYGDFVRPSGCLSGECAEPFDGEPIEMDQLVAQFSLRAGLTWSDGAPLTVADSVFGFALNGDPDTPAGKYRVERTQSYEALDAQTVRWTGVPGFIDPDYQSIFWFPAPQHLWGEFSAAELVTSPESAQMPVGFGPFVITEAGSDRYDLRRNPVYFRAPEGLPRVDRLVFRVVGQDPQTNLDMLRSGECDLLDPGAAAGIGVAQVLASMADGELFSSWANDDGWTLLNFGVSPQSYDDGYSFWAGDRPDFFGDVLTRQAVAMCIDREAITEEITLGVASVMDTYLPPDHALFNEDVATYARDLDAASDLLEEAGWVLNGEGKRVASGIEGVRENEEFSIEILYAEHPQNTRVVELVSEQLAECGITAQPIALSVEELFTTGEDAPVFGRNFDLAYFAWQASPNPPCHLFLSEAIPGEDEERFPYKWGGWNATGWSNENYDAACRAARGSAPGMEVFTDNQALAQEIMADQLPVIPFFTFQHAALARPDICGMQLDPTGGMLWNIEQITYGENCP